MKRIAADIICYHEAVGIDAGNDIIASVQQVPWTLDDENEIELQHELSRLEKCHGEGSSETLEVLQIRFNTSLRQLNYFCAGLIARKLLAASRTRYGDHHSITRRALLNVGSVLLVQGHYFHLLEIAQKAQQIQEQTTGSGSELTLTAKLLTTAIYVCLNRRLDAIHLLRGMEETSLKALGPSHDCTLRIQAQLLRHLVDDSQYGEGERRAKAMIEYLEMQQLKSGAAKGALSDARFGLGLALFRERFIERSWSITGIGFASRDRGTRVRTSSYPEYCAMFRVALHGASPIR